MWDEDTYKTDIALMKLATPIEEYNDYQMPICIPDSTIEGHLVSEMQMQVSGFGDVQNRPDGNFQFSDKLKSVMVPMVSSELCQSWYGSDFEVLPDQICAGHAEGKRDACVGDSGGPMVRHFDVEGSDVYYQIGIVSFGFECGKPKEPGVYSRVTTYRDWIYSAMQHYDSYLDN
jgi:secreted trypsin-like serine protease